MGHKLTPLGIYDSK